MPPRAVVSHGSGPSSSNPCALPSSTQAAPITPPLNLASQHAASEVMHESMDTSGSTTLSSDLLGSCFALEICCGSARLMEAFKVIGMKVVGIDHSFNTFSPAVLTVNIDLSDPEQHHLLWSWVCNPKVRFVAMAPPCGTSTRAREKPGGPRPLRSEDCPLGLPHLTAIEQRRVDKANIIYMLVVDIAKYCLEKGILFSLRNRCARSSGTYLSSGSCWPKPLSLTSSMMPACAGVHARRRSGSGRMPAV